ncbi:reverse transcriptase N-terminal domain-containing protein (plasmid) [Escherichia coli]|nr:reverse transcriptase N-terminal domain-containing protein [Escherichia coli]
MPCPGRKLQLRIAKATRQQQWRQVRELQRILTRSFSGKPWLSGGN